MLIEHKQQEKASYVTRSPGHLEDYTATIPCSKMSREWIKAEKGDGGKVEEERKSSQETEFRDLNQRYFHLFV